jgi:hypothetical protein
MAALKHATVIPAIVFVLLSVYQAPPVQVEARKNGKKLFYFLVM